MNETVYLNNDVEMPLLGLGTYGLTEEGETVSAVLSALDAGYRLIDTASVYKNEEHIGKALSRCGISRRELFITTKVWNAAQRLGDIGGAFQRSLERLQLDYVDLYMVHWPVPGCFPGTWRELERILSSGKASAIGVCNFEIRHLEQLRRISGIVPAVNQIECHPFCQRTELVEYCRENGIQVQAYAPLARGAYMDHDVMCVLGTKYGRTPAQIGLRWAVQQGIAVIPKSSRPDRIVSNADIFSFSIEEEDMDIMETLDQDFRSAGIPDDLKDVPF